MTSLCQVAHFPRNLPIWARYLSSWGRLSRSCHQKMCSVLDRGELLGSCCQWEGYLSRPWQSCSSEILAKATTVTKVKGFLGTLFLLSAIHKFLCWHYTPSASMYHCHLMWTQEADDALSRLEFALTEAPLLIYPQLDAEFVLDTDASSTGIGAVLSQQVNREERVVAYFSCSLSLSELHYCVFCWEVLVMEKAIKHFHAYLYGRKFWLRTDHSALRWLLNFQYLEGQVPRWIENLQQYDLAVEHRPGAKHCNADALSRWPCLRDYCKHCDRLESWIQFSKSHEHTSVNKDTCSDHW